MQNALLDAAPFGRWTGCAWTTVATQAHLDLCGLRSSQLPHHDAVADEIMQTAKPLSGKGHIDPSDLSGAALLLISRGLCGLPSEIVSGLADMDSPPTTLPALIQEAGHALSQAHAYLAAVESDAACAERWATEAVDAIRSGHWQQAQDLLAAIYAIESAYEPKAPVWGPWVGRVQRSLIVPPPYVGPIAVNAEFVLAT